MADWLDEIAAAAKGTTAPIGRSDDEATKAGNDQSGGEAAKTKQIRIDPARRDKILQALRSGDMAKAFGHALREIERLTGDTGHELSKAAIEADQRSDTAKAWHKCSAIVGKYADDFIEAGNAAGQGDPVPVDLWDRAVADYIAVEKTIDQTDDVAAMIAMSGTLNVLESIFISRRERSSAVKKCSDLPIKKL